VSGIAIKELLEGTGMKFGKVAVVGNPPYQKNNDKGGGTTHASPIYNLFVEEIIDHVKPDYFSFIIPSRWMVGGRGLDKFRTRMMNDKRLKKIVHFPGDTEVFESVSIKGGVNYFLWDKIYNGDCNFISNGVLVKRNLAEENVILQDNNAITILNKIKNICGTYMNKPWAIQTPFGIISSFSNWKTSGTKCITKGRKLYFVNSSDFIDKCRILGKWKVCTCEAISSIKGQFSNGVKSFFTNDGIFIIEPGTICTQTYIVVNVFDTKCEAENFVSYMKTKFFRFMLGLRVVTQHINKEKFAWVPDLEDYSKPWTDEELYRKFELTDDETKHIESKIKPIV
jgi:site-specific DNA-methyltransferase (adenine-specific)